MNSVGARSFEPRLSYGLYYTVSVKIQRLISKTYKTFQWVLECFDPQRIPTYKTNKNFEFYQKKFTAWKIEQIHGTRLDQYAKLQANIFMFLSFLDINHSNLLKLSRLFFSNECYKNIDTLSSKCSKVFRLSNPIFPLFFLALSSYSLNKNYQKGVILREEMLKLRSNDDEAHILLSLDNHLSKIPLKQTKKFEAALKKLKKLTENFSKLFILHSRLITSCVQNNNSEKIYIKISKCAIKCFFEFYDIYVHQQIILRQKNWGNYFNCELSSDFKILDHNRKEIETYIFNEIKLLNSHSSQSVQHLHETFLNKHFYNSKEEDKFIKEFINSDKKKILLNNSNDSDQISLASKTVDKASTHWLKFFEKFSVDFDNFLKKSLRKKYTVEHKLLKFNQKIRYAKICFNAFQATVTFSLANHKVSLIREICNILAMDLAKKIHLFGFQFILIVAPNLGLKVFNNILILFAAFLYSRQLKPNECSLRGYYLHLKIDLLIFLLNIHSSISYFNQEVLSKILFFKFDLQQSNEEKILQKMATGQNSGKKTFNLRQSILQAEEEIKKLRHHDLTNIFNEAYEEIIRKNENSFEDVQSKDFTSLFSDLYNIINQSKHLPETTKNALSSLDIDLKSWVYSAANNSSPEELKQKFLADLFKSFDKSEQNFMPKERGRGSSFAH